MWGGGEAFCVYEILLLVNILKEGRFILKIWLSKESKIEELKAIRGEIRSLFLTVEQDVCE